MTNILTLKDIKCGYGNIEVCHGISLTVSQNECIGLFGPNGHGKTTLLQAISGIIPVTSGQVHFDGQDITNLTPHKIVEAGLVQSSQGNILFSDMTVQETLEMSAYCPRSHAKKQDNLNYVYDLFPRLAERRKQKVGTMSGGERQMVSISSAIMCNPKLLILDEPTLGLSPKLKAELGIAIEKIVKTNLSMIVIEQDVEFLLRLSKQLFFIEDGEVANTFDAEHTLDSSDITKLYFGEG